MFYIESMTVRLVNKYNAGNVIRCFMVIWIQHNLYWRTVLLATIVTIFQKRILPKAIQKDTQYVLHLKKFNQSICTKIIYFEKIFHRFIFLKIFYKW